MPISKHQREKLLALCGQLNEDDAVDPREFFRKKYRTKDSKALRLCKQVADTLSLVLSGEFSDEVLQSLEVFSVQPAPSSKRLLVVVKPHEDILDTTTPAEIVQKLDTVKSILRSEMAAAISRSKTPSLVFEVVWPQDDC
ncbi:hypothetical protein [Fuerstiella marisgermanici]|uniref:Ribosome-binding factor A n=1 Tax=Fuerstiella marisgermanici TaxID=1891926 RepID=A0A1P8W9Z4_9PLAN|nr:hypothetical protein [Fuerstiella marisgermanici]APZ90884.1 ribosome-binding factor A [Fuerstiella marisgermanici]